VNNYKKVLLGAASALALSAGGPDVAQASLPVENAARASHPAVGAYSDRLVDLIMRTKGDLSSAAVQGTLTEMFKGASPNEVEHLPQFLADVMALGVTPDAATGIKDALIDVVLSNSSIPDSVRHSIVAQLASEAGMIQLAAKKQQCPPGMTLTKLGPNRFHCEPDEVGQVPKRDPNEVGQTGGGGPGGY